MSVGLDVDLTIIITSRIRDGPVMQGAAIRTLNSTCQLQGQLVGDVVAFLN